MRLCVALHVPSSVSLGVYGLETGQEMTIFSPASRNVNHQHSAATRPLAITSLAAVQVNVVSQLTSSKQAFSDHFKHVTDSNLTQKKEENYI